MQITCAMSRSTAMGKWPTSSTTSRDGARPLWFCGRTAAPPRVGNTAYALCSGPVCLSCLVTDLPLTPAGVWHFYDGRAAMERRIRELREDFALPKIPTRSFAANALYLEIIRLAYNLVTTFQRTCLEPN